MKITHTEMCKRKSSLGDAKPGARKVASIHAMTEKAAKAERSLANTCAKLGVTETGKRWLDLCLDPFKDLNMPTAGYPDSVTIPSVVQTIHDSYSVAVPASVTSGNNWDASIFIDQLYNNVQMYQTTYDIAQQVVYQGTQSATAYSRGGLVVRSGPAGNPLGITTTTFGASFKQDVLSQGDVRLIGVGMEIHNTTGELYKQGALIVYRVPDAPVGELGINQLIDTGATACVPLTQSAVQLVEIPTTASQAIDMPGSLQWDAKDGCYIVPILSSPTNYPSNPEVLCPVVYDEVAAAYYYPRMGVAGTAKIVTLANNTSNILHGFSPSGVYLTGLSYQTTLQVNLTYYVEVFPTKASVLRRSVQPAPGLDAPALDLYAHIIAHMPVGVEVNDNFLGAFIAGIARIASTVVPFFVRNAGTISRGLGLASDIVSSVASNPRPPPQERRPEVREVIEEVNSPAIQRELNRQQVALRPSAGPVISDIITRGREIVTQQNRNGITRTEWTPSNVRRNNNVSMKRTEKAKAKKNRIIDMATKGYAGNRWIDNPKKK